MVSLMPYCNYEQVVVKSLRFLVGSVISFPTPSKQALGQTSKSFKVYLVHENEVHMEYGCEHCCIHILDYIRFRKKLVDLCCKRISKVLSNGSCTLLSFLAMLITWFCGVRENTFSTLIEASFNRKGIRYFVYNTQPHNMT